MANKVLTHLLISIRADATVQDAANLMVDCSIGALGVFNAEKEFAGIITERDLSWFVAQAKDPEGTRVSAIVNDFPVVVEGPIDDADAIDQMKTSRVRHLIVREGKDYRILSMRDFFSIDLAQAPVPVGSREIQLEEFHEGWSH
jgi:signal-transduction protein with cAMP-binding, CBS, and nucleotidyltransferase domain